MPGKDVSRPRSRGSGSFYGNRVTKHPVLEFDYRRKRKVGFSLDGREMEGFEGEPIAASLVASGVRVLRYSPKLGRPRGFFCALGRCSSCLMTVNGIPNVRTCVTPLAEGMVIRTQEGKGLLARRGRMRRADTDDGEPGGQEDGKGRGGDGCGCGRTGPT